MPKGNAEAERRGDRPLAGPGGYAITQSAGGTRTAAEWPETRRPSPIARESTAVAA